MSASLMNLSNMSCSMNVTFERYFMAVNLTTLKVKLIFSFTI